MPDQPTEDLKALMSQVFPVVDASCGGVSNQDIKSPMEKQWKQQLAHTFCHLPFGVLVLNIPAVAHRTAQTDDSDSFVDIILAVDGDTAFRWSGLIFCVVVAVDV